MVAGNVGVVVLASVGRKEGARVDPAVGEVGVELGAFDGAVGIAVGNALGLGVPLGLAVVIKVLGKALILVYPSLRQGTTSS